MRFHLLYYANMEKENKLSTLLNTRLTVAQWIGGRPNKPRGHIFFLVTFLPEIRSGLIVTQSCCQPQITPSVILAAQTGEASKDEKVGSNHRLQ